MLNKCGKHTEPQLVDLQSANDERNGGAIEKGERERKSETRVDIANITNLIERKQNKMCFLRHPPTTSLFRKVLY